MHTFKIGDRVTWGNRCYSFVIKEITDSCVNVDGSSGIDIEYGSSVDFGNDIESVSISELELIEPKTTGPVHEKVVKEIVCGTYGTVTVSQSSTGEHRYFVDPYMTATQLRSAAETFLAIADALEGE